MKEPALVIIKPDGLSKGLLGNVLIKFSSAHLEIIGVKIARSTKKLVEKHYHHLKGKPFFEGVVKHLMGEFYPVKDLVAVIYYGEDAIKKCRKIAGATNPEEAHPESVRGSYGRVVKKGKYEIFENVVHVSSSKSEAKREIQIWFKPDEVTRKLYKSRTRWIETHKEKVWE